MALPRWLARFNVAFTNRLMVPIAAWLPYFGVIEHVGRRSGRQYRTPVNVFRHGDRYVFALTYGTTSEWVRNVETAGECHLVQRRGRVRLVAPRRFTDARRRDVLVLLRPVLAILDVAEFLELRRASDGQPAPAARGQPGAAVGR